MSCEVFSERVGELAEACQFLHIREVRSHPVLKELLGIPYVEHLAGFACDFVNHTRMPAFTVVGTRASTVTVLGRVFFTQFWDRTCGPLIIPPPPPHLCLVPWTSSYGCKEVIQAIC